MPGFLERAPVLHDRLLDAALGVERAAQLVPRLEALQRELIRQSQRGTVEPLGLLVCIARSRLTRRGKVDVSGQGWLAGPLPVVGKRCQRLVLLRAQPRLQGLGRPPMHLALASRADLLVGDLAELVMRE